MNYDEVTDLACKDVTKLMRLIDDLPDNFGTTEEISIVERINHPTLTSEDQIYNKKKGVKKSVRSFLDGLLKTYKELGKLKFL